MKKYTFYADPAHGWLKVKRKELEALGLLNAISGYSYQKGDYVYLEEDRDTFYFMQAKGITNDCFVEKHTNRQSKIRSYESFNQSGGLDDSKINKELPHARIFPNKQVLTKAGYVDSSKSDLVASNPKNIKVGLIIH